MNFQSLCSVPGYRNDYSLTVYRVVVAARTTQVLARASIDHLHLFLVDLSRLSPTLALDFANLTTSLGWPFGLISRESLYQALKRQAPRLSPFIVFQTGGQFLIYTWPHVGRRKTHPIFPFKLQTLSYLN